ncbi:hypothetical protein [Pelagicoccus sp. SDUM812003]|uniref:hypothetical protein n=1 Tax=Pelagicoccus sp. SDUM812003 TaxID=3041267 RepID=UPI002810357B|nr:hypothetical protein [Pelagicoccus sp. SDUM812003]MDQ8204929.1 hypothetical protein [Pelagicoccus sp. SDUM812003]
MKNTPLLRTLLGASAVVAISHFAVAQDGTSSLLLSDQLEKAVYLQEGEADLDAAALVFEGILAETELLDSLAAEAHFRLASIYLEQGKESLAFKLLGELVERYPEEAPWFTEAKALLPKDFDPTITPWEDGERTWYDWVLPTGNVIGHSFSTIFRYDWEGRELWRKETRYLLNGNRCTVVEFEPETFKTLYSHMSLKEMGRVRAWYAEDGLSAKVQYAKSGQERSFNFNERVYDNEQAYELMRQLPLEPGYTMTKKIFVSFSGVPVDVTFKVESISEMDTVLGKVECYDVLIKIVGQEQHAFFTADDRRLLVKTISGGIESVLRKVETIDYDGTIEYRNEAHDYAITLPASWGAVPQDESNSADKQRVWLAEPTVRGVYNLTSLANSEWIEEEALTLDSLKNKAIEKVTSSAKGGLDETWTKELRLGELSGIALRTQPDDESGDEQRAYLYALLGNDRHYLWEARIPASDEPEMLPVFEGIMNSFVKTD